MKQTISILIATFIFNVHVNAQLRITKVTSTTYPASTTVESKNPGSTTNVIIGDNGSTASPTGIHNTFLGEGVGTSTGSDNTYIGQGVGSKTTTGGANTFVGRYTGISNEDGAANTFIGQYCGVSNVKGSGNTFIGQSSGNMSNAWENTFIGSNSGINSTNGSRNTFLGRNSGQNNYGGSYNNAIGYDSKFGNPNLFNATVIGSNATVNISNAIALGAPGTSVGIGTGSPSTLLHVNLTYPGSPNGIRFQGLPTGTALHTQSIVVDADGNLALQPYGSSSGTAWSLTGNAASGTDFIGTTINEDFRFKTFGSPRGMITRDGNFDFGINDFSSFSNTKSSALGDLNKLVDAHNSLASGKSNFINQSYHSGSFGSKDSIIRSDFSFALGSENLIAYGKTTFGVDACVALGARNKVTNSSESVVAGEENILNESHGSFMGGSHNESSAGSYNMIIGLFNKNFGDQNITIGNENEQDNAGYSHIYGNSSYTTGSQNFTIGNQSKTDGMNNYSLGNNAESIGASNYALGNSVQSIGILLDGQANNIFTFGQGITNRRNNSMIFGFDDNRTEVITKRGVAIQLQDPAPTLTYNPTVNFEVQAGVFPDPTSPLAIGSIQSNVRFHNLPVTNILYPTVVINTTTGELFHYIPGGNPPSLMQSTSSDSLNETIKNLKQSIKEQQKQIDALMTLVTTLTEVKQSETLAKIDIELSNSDVIVLYQNIPNPCDRYTSIGFSIPNFIQNATINFSSIDGKFTQSIPIKERGKGILNIQTTELTSGMYIYSLIADGQLIDSKKMEISR